jgi:hypothetical protein
MPDIVKYRCPHLGLENDPATWFAFPTKENHCHQRRKPQAVEPSYQQDFCLSDNYMECPLLASQKQVVEPIPDSTDVEPNPDSIDVEPIPDSTNVEPIPDGTGEEEREAARSRRRLAPWLWGVLILAVIGGALFIFGGPLWGGQRVPAPEPPTSTPPEAMLPPSETPTATLQPTTTPTATLSPTATLEPTLDVTTVQPSPGAAVLALAFDSYVRAGPGRDFATVAYLSAGTLVTILGRDLDGFWLWVRLDDGREGWVAITQFPADTVNVKAIPVAPEIPTPDVTATPGA